MKEKNETIDSLKRTIRIDKKKLSILTAIDEKNEKTLDENKLLIDKQEIAIKNLKERIIKKNFFMKKQRENLLKYSLNQSEVANKLAEMLFFVRAVVRTVNPNVLFPLGMVPLLADKVPIIAEITTAEILIPIMNEENIEIEIEIDRKEEIETESDQYNLMKKEKMGNREESEVDILLENVPQECSRSARVTALQGKELLNFIFVAVIILIIIIIIIIFITTILNILLIIMITIIIATIILKNFTIIF